MLPGSIYSGVWNGGHCQGIALDRKNGWMYYAFTTELIKTDLQGKLLGSVGGLTGHLGCISFCEEDGLVYASLEFKNDAIGSGILKHLGSDRKNPDAFYMTMFDGAKIDRPGMDAAKDGVMRAAYLKEVVDDYTAAIELPDGTKIEHRYGCSGIDGTAVGPMFGAPADSEKVLTVAYGVYGDVTRTDNDYQVLLSYSRDDLKRTAKPLSLDDMHTSGPGAPIKKLFVYTGNTTYGIQNLEYDANTRLYLAAVYTGKKKEFPNLPMYAIDAAAAPKKETLRGVYPETAGDVLTLAPGRHGGKNGVTGWTYGWGQTGLIALGDGNYYVSYDARNGKGWDTTVRLCGWNGEDPLAPVEKNR